VSGRTPHEVPPLVAAARRAGVRDPRVLRALAEVPRAAFVPRESEWLAEEDRPIPIGRRQVTTQPSLVAAMVEALGLTGRERVLEVGTGYGYQTAILAALADTVWSVERFRELAEAARANLAAAGVANAHVVVGDGSEGLPGHAPDDAVVVSAASPAVPAPLVEQLAIGGRLVHPVGPGGDERVTLFERRPEGLVERRLVTYAIFVPLVGRHGLPEE